MSATATKQERKSRTKIQFDLLDELTAEEVARFEASAREAKAKSLTEHFLNITLRLPSQQETQPA